jgi:hypothetical protein
MLTESAPVFINNLNQELQSTQLSITNIQLKLHPKRGLYDQT